MNSIATNDQVFSPAASLSSRWAKSMFIKLVERIKYGRIAVCEGKERMVFGDDGSDPVTITVLSPEFYSRVIYGGSIGAGEAFVDNLWQTDDLTRLVQIMARNMTLLEKIEQRFSWLLQPLRIIKHRLNDNSRSGSRKNILSHYDLGNEMYQSFLDPTMMYSSAIYPDETSSLEAASLHKLKTICEKLALGPVDHVIEIGSGWCGFALYAAQNYGCRVTTVTISDAQYEEGMRRIKEAGLEDRITLLKKDYRDVEGRFDKLVSIEMIEAVGHRYHPQFFATCSKLLKDNGLMLLQAITIRDQAYKKYINSVDFIQRHIFPGGCLISNERIVQLLSKRTDMVMRNLEDIGFDYARTLEDWRHRFNNSFSHLKRFGYDDSFKRLWNFYLCYCEGGFRERAISVVQLVASKSGNVSPARLT